MAARTERERERMNERQQAALGALLTESRECADCCSRGPRWASWNLGVFICIRCAGIHRNLGVHISKVKSVTLDQWTLEQIQSIQEMGNSKAKLLYEAYLPEDFKRPKADQAVETFIRDKYEKKKYFNKSIDVTTFRKENKWKKEIEAKESKPASVLFEKVKVALKKDEPQQLKTSPLVPPGATVDLLGLDVPATDPTTTAATGLTTTMANDLDLFGAMMSNPQPDPSTFQSTSLASAPQEAAENVNFFADPSVKQEDSGKKQLSKDSILSLYGSQPSHVPAQGAMFMPSAQASYAPCLPTGYANLSPPGTVATHANCMMGSVGQSLGMVAPMALPAGFMPGMQAQVMGAPSGMMGQQGAYMGVMPMPQPVYGVQQAQQLQWNIAQMTQHMAGMNFYSANGMVSYGQSPVSMGAGAAPTTGQSLGTQIWK